MSTNDIPVRVPGRSPAAVRTEAARPSAGSTRSAAALQAADAARSAGITPHAAAPQPVEPEARPPCRLLVVPGLYDSSPAHWQTWLQMRFPGAQRVYQRNWSTPDLDAWAARIGETLDAAGPGPWVAAAHSFGCLALMRHLLGGEERIRFALLVAPADPARFEVGAKLPAGAPLLPSTMLASENDPWMQLDDAREWARRWGSWLINLGAVGHINAEAGFGPLPDAAHLVERMLREVDRSESLAAVRAPGSRTRPAAQAGRYATDASRAVPASAAGGARASAARRPQPAAASAPAASVHPPITGSGLNWSV